MCATHNGSDDFGEIFLPVDVPDFRNALFLCGYKEIGRFAGARSTSSNQSLAILDSEKLSTRVDSFYEGLEKRDRESLDREQRKIKF